MLSAVFDVTSSKYSAFYDSYFIQIVDRRLRKVLFKYVYNLG